MMVAAEIRRLEKGPMTKFTSGVAGNNDNRRASTQMPNTFEQSERGEWPSQGYEVCVLVHMPEGSSKSDQCDCGSY
jgi:hypothetical protein